MLREAKLWTYLYSTPNLAAHVTRGQDSEQLPERKVQVKEADAHGSAHPQGPGYGV